MGGWSFESIPNIWINFASCFICQNVCRTNAVLVTVKLRRLTTVEPTWCFSLPILHWDPAVLVSRFATVPVRDQISLVHQNPHTSYGGLEAFGWLHGRSLWPICLFEMEGHAFRLALWLWVWRGCPWNLQWLGCRQKHLQISVWQCNLLQRMLGVLIIKDSKDRVTVERRIGNICCRFSFHGCHPH